MKKYEPRIVKLMLSTVGLVEKKEATLNINTAPVSMVIKSPDYDVNKIENQMVEEITWNNMLLAENLSELEEEDDDE